MILPAFIKGQAHIFPFNLSRSHAKTWPSHIKPTSYLSHQVIYSMNAIREKWSSREGTRREGKMKSNYYQFLCHLHKVWNAP